MMQKTVYCTLTKDKDRTDVCKELGENGDKARNIRLFTKSSVIDKMYVYTLGKTFFLGVMCYNVKEDVRSKRTLLV